MFDEELAEDTAFNDTLQRLETLSGRADFSMGPIEEEMKTLEEYAGLGWTSRRPLKAAETAGTLLAYQAFIMRYKKRHPER